MNFSLRKKIFAMVSGSEVCICIFLFINTLLFCADAKACTGKS